MDIWDIRNRQEIIELSAHHDIFGAYWDKGSSPTLTRFGGAVGAIATAGVDAVPAYNSFDTSSLFKDFSTVTDGYGNEFIRIPKIYIKKVDTAGYKTWQASRKPFAGAYLPWCFWDFVNNKELDYIDVGKYKASLSADTTKLESKQNVYPLINRNIVDFRTLAKANGAGYQQLDIHVVDLLQVLFTIEQATLNSQSIAAGYTAGQYTATHLALATEAATNRIVVDNAFGALYSVGQAISVGTTQGGNQVFYGRTITAIAVDTPITGQTAIVFDGAAVNIATGNMLYNAGYKNGFSANVAASVGSINSNSSGEHPLAWHGIESLFGDVFQWVDGVNINDLQAWVCRDAAMYSSNLFTSPYQQLGYANAPANGYVSAMGSDPAAPFAEFPVSVVGAPTTYYADYYYQSIGQRVARFGGSWYNGSSAGLWYWDLSLSSASAYVSLGGRLIRKAL